MADSSTQSRIRELEEELSSTKYNKRTQNAIGLLKAKIANLKEKSEQHEKRSQAAHGFTIKKTGDATVVILGYPSVGKSTLLNRLTNANSAVAAYPFTTLTVIPGLLEHKNAKIQILDMPGILEGAATGIGRGKEALNVIRSADLLLVVIDATHRTDVPALYDELYIAGIRLNENRPNIKITKTMRGGILIGKTVRLTKTSDETIKAILQELRMMNCQVLIRQDISADQLIDVVKGNRKYLPCIAVANKVDLVSQDKARQIRCDIAVSAINGMGIEALKELIFRKLELIRIYCKEVGKRADLEQPIILKRGSTVEDVCQKLHKDFASRFRYVKVWGKSAKFGGQSLGISHVIMDEDVVEIHLV